VIEVPATEIAHLNAFEIVPNALVRVEIGSIPWELFQVQSFTHLGFEKGFALAVPMDGEPSQMIKILPLIFRKSTFRNPITATAS
jgi:hypothetical protein